MKDIVPASRPLPKIEDLYADVELAAKNNDLQRLLNQSPKPEWIKADNKFTNGSQYIPIGILEWLATAIFGGYRTEIKSIQVIANSCVATVRVFVRNPITFEMDWQDGVGASPIQTSKGAAATDFTQVNTLAVQMAAPASESMAIKDALEKFGKIFGRDLNRKPDKLIAYDSMLETQSRAIGNRMEIPEELQLLIKEADSEALATIYRANPELHENDSFFQALAKRKEQIRESKTIAE